MTQYSLRLNKPKSITCKFVRFLFNSWHLINFVNILDWIQVDLALINYKCQRNLKHETRQRRHQLIRDGWIPTSTIMKGKRLLLPCKSVWNTIQSIQPKIVKFIKPPRASYNIFKWALQLGKDSKPTTGIMTAWDTDHSTTSSLKKLLIHQINKSKLRLSPDLFHRTKLQWHLQPLVRTSRTRRRRHPT